MIITSSGVAAEIIRLQETLKTYSNSIYDLRGLSGIASGWTSSTKYAMSTWIKMPALQTPWAVVFRLALNPR